MDVTSLEVIGGTSVNDCKRDLNSSPQVIVGSPGRVLDMIQRKYLFTDKITTLIFEDFYPSTPTLYPDPK